MLKTTMEEQGEIIKHLSWRLREMGIVAAVLDNNPREDPDRDLLEAYQKDLISGYKGRGLIQKINRVDAIKKLFRDRGKYNIQSQAEMVFNTRLISPSLFNFGRSDLFFDTYMKGHLEWIFDLEWNAVIHVEEDPPHTYPLHIEKAMDFVKNMRIEIGSLYAYSLQLFASLETNDPFEVARDCKYKNASNLQLWLLREILMLMEHDMIYNHKSELFTPLYSYILSSNINPLQT